MQNNREYEEKYSNLDYICGVDEVGRGPLVGPVVASAVILPKNYYIEGLTDSKKLSKKKRESFFEIINKDALAIGIGVVDNKKIDEINILEASRLAMKIAVNNLKIKPDVILTDAMKLDMGIDEEDIIKGDLKSITISAASVIAKVTRDKMMEELHEKYPMYNFIKNNGYPTKEHVEAIKKYGIIEEHRKTFNPIRDIIKK
jgi:ribonuclease HII